MLPVLIALMGLEGLALLAAPGLVKRAVADLGPGALRLAGAVELAAALALAAWIAMKV